VRAVTTKADFSDEEWERLERAPFVAGMAITFADPGGPIEVLKESMASLRAVLDSVGAEDRGELVQAVAESVDAKAKQRQNPAKGFKPKGALAGEQILDELRGVNELVGQKATPEEAADYRAWLLAAAKRVAEAAKEGGFMGFHAERVSEGEQQMLDKLGEVLA
jgi:hypothetical protein